MDSAIWLRDAEVLVCDGEQAAWYLNGQLSVSVDSLEIGNAKRALLLEPDGSLVAPVGVKRRGEAEFALFVPVGSQAKAMERLERFRLRTKVSFSTLAGCVVFLSDGVGEECEALEEAVMARIPSAAPASCVAVGGLSVGELYGELSCGDAERLLSDIGSLDNTDFSRIISGQPEWGSEITGGMNPTELGEAFIHSRADFQKGCYTGQELIERVDSRGYKTPRHMSSFIVSGDPATLSSFEEKTFEEQGRPVYTLTSYQFCPSFNCGIGLGFVHRLAGEFRSKMEFDSVEIEAMAVGELAKAIRERR